MTRPESQSYLMGAIEALLFVSDEPVSCAKLAEFSESEPEEAKAALEALQEEYAQDNRGIQLREVAGGWRLFSHPAYHDLIESYVVSWDTRRMSQAALEALAIIAYHQPVTRAGVNAVRGVSSDGVISSLVEKGLVKEVGREKSAGAAILYGTTRAFLEKFGLKSIKELPPLEDFAPDEASRELIRERLSGAGRSQDAQLTLDEVSDEAEAEAVNISVVSSDGTLVVEDVDFGSDERVDDPDAMAAIIGEALTAKADVKFAEAEADAGADDDDAIVTVD